MVDEDGWSPLHCSARYGSYESIRYFADMGIGINLNTNDGRNCLHIAALYGHLNLCKTLIVKHNFDVHKTDNEGWTALHHSSTNGSYELLAYFADMGINIECKDNFGSNCFHIAALYGHFNLCKVLIEKHNFDIHVTDNVGGTALHYSAGKGTYELTTYFADMGIDIYCANKLGKNCLHIAASCGNINLCKKLIDNHKFDAHMPDNDGNTFLHCSATNGIYELFSYFADMETDINCKNNLGSNCLHIAAQYGHLNLCKELINKHNFDIHIADNDGCTALHYSASSGNYELLTYFADMGADINCKSNLGWNCLHFAANYGHLNLCKALIDNHNFDLHVADNVGWTALHHSAKNGSCELIRYFSVKGININCKNNLGWNCLHIAAQNGHLSLCKTLIDKHSFDVHIVDNEGWTALHHSARSGSYDLVRYFSVMGNDIECKNNLGSNCLHIAALYGHLNLCKILINKHNFDMRVVDNNEWTALHYSAKKGSYDLITYFADMGTQINCKNGNGMNCLHIAAQNGHLSLCKKLIDEHKIDLHITDNLGSTALHHSAKNGSYELVLYLTNMGAKIDVKNSLGWNCLHITAQNGHLNLCKTLIDEYNFDVHIADNKGWTGLHHSAKVGSYELIIYFNDMGIDIDCKNNLGWNCLHIAALSGNLSLCKILIDKHNFDMHMVDNDGCAALHHSARNGSYELVTYFAGEGTDINLKNKNGINCLHIAAMYGHLNLCKKLIDRYNFDAHRADNHGWLALHYSARNGSYELVKYFADMGTDIACKSYLGSNCLHIAALYGHFNLCKTLIDKHNFDVNMADNEGFTPLHQSLKYGSYELITYFTGMGASIDLRANNGMNLLHIAATYAHLSLCKLLIDKFNFALHVTSDTGLTALHHSATSGSYELVRYFAVKGINIDLKNDKGMNCLHIAALCGHLDLCRTLINEHNFDVHMADNDGCTALLHSAKNGSCELFTYLAGVGSNIDSKNCLGCNCLHIAAQNGHLNLCKTIIDKYKIDVHMVDNDGWTPLHHSGRNGSYELVTYFADMGNDIYGKCNLGSNIVHIAAHYGHLSLLKTLIDKHHFDVNTVDNDGRTALHHSASNGSYELVTYFAGMGTNIHVKDNNGMNCLHMAAFSGNLHLCKTLIDQQNFDVHMVDNDGRTALHHSVRSGSNELVKYFADTETSIYCKTNFGQNSLHIAAQNGHLNLCKTLLSNYKFDIHLTDNYGWAAIHYSARNGSYELVKYFSDMGTNINCKNNLGENCLHIAASFRNLNLCKTLIEKHSFDVHLSDNNGCTALHHSAASGSYELVSYFADMESDIGYQNIVGMNCLHTAAFHGHLNLCKALIEKHKFSIHVTDNHGWTALLAASASGGYELVKYFADMGTDIDCKSNLGRNCLHIAARYGHLNLCKTLLDKHNFYVDNADNLGWTTLHHSVVSGIYELVTYFADMVTDIDLKVDNGMNCLHIAASCGHLNICKSLVEKHNFDVHMGDKEEFTALHYSAAGGSYEIVTYFADKGIDIRSKNKLGWNCLHIASGEGYLNLCKTLIDKHKFDMHMADDGGWTALHHAVRKGSYELVTYLVGAGADIGLKVDNGMNCLHIAAGSGHLNLCKILVDKFNFDVKMTCKAGWTALHASATNGNYDLFTYFLEMGTDINLETNDGTNCLHLAAGYGHLNLCKALVDNYNFDVNMTNNDEWTALHFSAEFGSFDLFLYFLGKGSEIYCKTNSMKNVLHLSAHKGHFDICEYVLEYFIKDYTDNNTRNQHTYNGKSYRSQVFYKYSTIFLHAMDVDGNTYLHLAAEGNHSKICELLLKYDTEIITLLNKKDETARNIAKSNGYNDVLDALKTEFDREGMFFLIYSK